MPALHSSGRYSRSESIVYVDSGSTDGSVSFAEGIGVLVEPLDMSQPFTAARARNEGFRSIERNLHKKIEFVQFIDGDCELDAEWPFKAVDFLKKDPSIALVCGRRRERAPEASIYNRLCDIEWDTPIGETKASGGDFIVRGSAFSKVGGFNAALIAGEEPELCFRLRQAGMTIWRLDAEMTLHDAAMTTISQWWARTVRAGYAFACGAALHGRSPERYWVRETLRSLIYGGLIPVIAVLGAILVDPAFFLLFGVYGFQIARMFLKFKFINEGRLAYAVFCTFGKIPEFVGASKFWLGRIFGRTEKIIEYK